MTFYEEKGQEETGELWGGVREVSENRARSKGRILPDMKKGDIGYMINIGLPISLDEESANRQMVARYNQPCAIVVSASHMPKMLYGRLTVVTATYSL